VKLKQKSDERIRLTELSKKQLQTAANKVSRELRHQNLDKKKGGEEQQRSGSNKNDKIKPNS